MLAISGARATRFSCSSNCSAKAFCKNRSGGYGTAMAKSSKLIATKRGRILLVRRRRDRLWMFPGGRRRGGETEKGCLRREIREELPKLKLGRLKLWKEINVKNPRSGRKMSDAIFI